MDEKEKTTEEQLKELEEKIAALTTRTEQTISDLTAERDGMKEMLDKANKENEDMKKEIQDLKKLNFVLASTKDQKSKESFEHALLGMMGVKTDESK